MRRSVRRGAAAFAALIGLAAAPAGQAMTVPAPQTLDAGPLGKLQVSGGIDGYMYALTGADAAALGGGFTTRSAGAIFMNGLVEVQKPVGLLQFTLQAGATTPFTLGTAPTPASAQLYPTGALYAAYATLAPSPDFSISAGQIGSLEGYESSIDWQNANVLTTDLFYVENGQELGVQVNYQADKLTLALSIGDGFDTGVWNYLQALVAYTVSPTVTATLFGATNLGRTGPGAHFYGAPPTPFARSFVGYGPLSAAPLVNSTVVGGYVTLQRGALSLTPEAQYVYTKSDHAAGLDDFSANFGAALFADWSPAGTPFSLGAWGGYFASTGPDLWFLAPRAKGVELSLTPTWQMNHVFLRGDLGLLHLTDSGTGAGYGTAGTARNQATALVEAGLVF